MQTDKNNNGECFGIRDRLTGFIAAPLALVVLSWLICDSLVAALLNHSRTPPDLAQASSREPAAEMAHKAAH